MKKRVPLIYKILGFLGIFLLIIFLLMIKSVADSVAGWLGKDANGNATTSGDTIRSFAATAAGLVIGVMLVTWGIAALAIPWLGAVMIIGGLAMIAWNVYPLFSSSSTIKTP